jgi:hypothetical protein
MGERRKDTDENGSGRRVNGHERALMRGRARSRNGTDGNGCHGEGPGVDAREWTEMGQEKRRVEFEACRSCSVERFSV